MDTRELWRLIGESGLAPAERWAALKSQFAGVKRAGEQANGAALAEWLVAQKEITRYQAKILLAGKSGPFVYGDYVVRERLTSGRLAGLFRAMHAGTRHPVLLQFLTGPVVKDPALYRAAAAQLARAARAVHPCLMQVYQLVDEGNFKFIVVEDLNGGSCDEVLATKKRASTAVACRLVRQVAVGAGAVHAAGLVHGEIRPRNIWVDGQGHGRLLQVPLVREPQLAAPTMHVGSLSAEQLAGAADYFAPEMARPGQTADVLTDVYALGCTLYELLSGRAPFAGGDAATKMPRHAREAIAPLGPLGVPEALAKVVAFAMAKDRRVRIQSAAQLAEALEPFIDPGKAKLMPKPAATNAVYEAWRRTQPIVPQVVAVSASEPVSAIATPSANGAPEWTAYGEPAHVAVAEVGHEALAIGAPPVRSAGPATESLAAAEWVASPDAFVQPVAPGVKSPAFAALQRRHRQQRMNALITLAVLLIAGLAGGIVYLAYFRERPIAHVTEESDAVVEQASGDTTSVPETELSKESVDAAADDKGNGVASVAASATDDGKMLWVSPTAGEKIELEYLPPSVDLVVHVRPAELIKHPEGEKLLAALGPYGASMRGAVESATGLKLVEMERLIVGWAADEPAAVTLIVRPALISQTEAVIGKWQSYQARTVGSEQLYTGGGWTYFAPGVGEKKVFVVSSSKSVDQIASAGAAAPAPKLDLLKVAATSDASRMVTVLFTTSAVFGEGGSVFGGLGQLRSAAEWFFADVRSAALSLHLQPEVCYVEARLVSGVETTPYELADRYRERLQEMPSGASAHVVSLPLHPHGKMVLFRFPQMVSFLQEHTRSGVDAEQVVLNSYLPVVAAHNLLMGGELALSETGRGSEETGSSTSQATKTSDPSERLKTVTTLVAQRQPLESLAVQIGQEANLRIEIVGQALEQAGITRNQPISIDIKDKPAGEILREVMLKANPDGKLVYVFQKSAEGEESLVITTRAMAAKNGQRLPPEFAAEAGKRK